MTTRELSILRETALALDESERARLAHDLVASLDGPGDASASAAWDAEIIRRINEIDEGRTPLLDASEAIADLRKRILQAP